MLSATQKRADVQSASQCVPQLEHSLVGPLPARLLPRCLLVSAHPTPFSTSDAAFETKCPYHRLLSTAPAAPATFHLRKAQSWVSDFIGTSRGPACWHWPRATSPPHTPCTKPVPSWPIGLSSRSSHRVLGGVRSAVAPRPLNHRGVLEGWPETRMTVVSWAWCLLSSVLRCDSEKPGVVRGPLDGITLGL